MSQMDIGQSDCFNFYFSARYDFLDQLARYPDDFEILGSKMGPELGIRQPTFRSRPHSPINPTLMVHTPENFSRWERLIRKATIYSSPLPSLFGLGWTHDDALLILSFTTSLVWLILFLYCLIRFPFRSTWYLIPAAILGLGPFLSLAVLISSFRAGSSP
jgi:hypothetical protein